MNTEVKEILKMMEFREDFYTFLYKQEFFEFEDSLFEQDDIKNAESELTNEDYLIRTVGELGRLISYYKSRHIPLEILLKTLEDFKYRVDRFYFRNNYYGLSAHDMKWLGYIFRGETFQIHNLKFRKYPLTYKEIERSGDDYLPLSREVKDKYYEGLPVVYVHIAKDADLSDESVKESFRQAHVFFKNHFSDYSFEYYICRTWMLYPGLKNIMSEESNIIKFQNRFEIIGTHDNPDQSLSRIYDTTDLTQIKTHEKNTSLMRSAYLNLDSLGVGVGVISKNDIEEEA